MLSGHAMYGYVGVGFVTTHMWLMWKRKVSVSGVVVYHIFGSAYRAWTAWFDSSCVQKVFVNA